MGLQGDLGELPLADLVEMTSVGGKTGRLVLRDEEEAVAGMLMFRGGRLVSARCNELVGEKAFYALLSLKTGSFDFDPTAELDEEVDLPTESLLIEGMRRLDETSRLRRRLPSWAIVRYLDGGGENDVETRILSFLGLAWRSVGEVVEGILAEGGADEYDILAALRRLAAHEIVRVEFPQEDGGGDAPSGPLPQP